MKTLYLIAIIVFLAFAARTARADGLVFEPAPNWSCSPVGMVTGYQLDLKTKDFQRGAAIGAGYGCRYTGWKFPVGASAVGAIALNDNAPNAGQGSLLVTVADNYAVGPGLQVFRDPVDGSYTAHVLLSLSLTASWAATVEQFKTSKARAAQAAREP